MLPGVHKVPKRHRNGDVSEYWYAFRGGPQILHARARSDALLAAAVAKLAPDAVVRFREQQQSRDDHLLYGLITRYLASSDFGGLAPRTRRDRQKFLDVARTELGHMELRLLRAPGARKTLLDWRNRYKETPKTADELLGALSTALQWGHDNEGIAPNPVAGFKRLYKSNRADAIWEPQHLDVLLPHCAKEFRDAVLLALHTGLRLGDLITLTWSAVGDDVIRRPTSKSSGQTMASIPITDELRALLRQIPRCDSTTILNSARKRPWSVNGIESAMRRAKLDAQAAATKTNGPGAQSGIDHLRFHDLRGTAATAFVRAGLRHDQVALILGWKPSRVEQILQRYVTGESIGAGMAEQLRQNKARTKV